MLVVAGALLAAERADELADHLEGDHDQGGGYPQGKLRVAGPVGAPGREAPGGGRQPALDPPVDLADPGDGRKSLLAVAEDDRQGGLQHRPKAAQGVVLEAAVSGHASRDQRMGKLQQHRGWPAQQQQPLARDVPDLGAGPEQAGSPAIPGGRGPARSRGLMGPPHGGRARRAGWPTTGSAVFLPAKPAHLPGG